MIKKIGVIFDLDGVIIDNSAYHEKAWIEFCKKYSITLSEKEFYEFIFGRVAKDTLEFMFKKELTNKEIEDFVEEKEIIYRAIFRKHIKPLAGLLPFLNELTNNQVPMALATSAPPGNVDFAFNYLPIKKYFNFTFNASHISKGKPDPEIYIKTINALDLKPENCIVFEDSLSGIKAAIAAGANVIGVSTTHQPHELNGVKKVIADFTDLYYEDLLLLIY